jgi:hypothetical protein
MEWSSCAGSVYNILAPPSSSLPDVGNEDQRIGLCLETWEEILRKPFTPDLFLDRVVSLLSRGVDAERTVAEA